MLQTASPDAIRRIQLVQIVTIAWMSVEALVSLFAAWIVVLWRFRASDAHEHSEKRAARFAGALLFALAVYVVITSVASQPGL
jgi:hypothetical protein